MSKLDKKDTLRTAWNIITSGAEWPFEPEVAVIPGRRFRVDWYSETLKLAIEVEGMVYGGRGGHQTVGGYESNCEKYNEKPMQCLRRAVHSAQRNRGNVPR